MSDDEKELWAFKTAHIESAQMTDEDYTLLCKLSKGAELPLGISGGGDEANCLDFGDVLSAGPPIHRLFIQLYVTKQNARFYWAYLRLNGFSDLFIDTLKHCVKNGASSMFYCSEL